MRSAIMIGAALAIGACNDSNAREGHEGGGRAEQIRRDFQVGAFDRVELAGSSDVVVAVGGAPSVRAEGDSRLIERLEIRVENGVLKIGHKKGSWSFGWNKDRPRVTVHVATPSLRGAEIVGSGNVSVDRVQADEFRGGIAGSGDLQIAALQAKAARFEVAGSGNIRAVGRTETADINIAGNGDVAAGALEARRANVSIAGSGNVEARAMDSADIKIMGSGDVTLSGTARCNVSKMGSGNARCTG
jgi:hypothetical protein